MNTPDPTSAVTDTNLKNRLLRHLDSCLKEIDADIFAIDKRYENHENFNIVTAMREMSSVKSPPAHNKISTFNSDLTVTAALNLSMNSTVSDQDENNNGTDDNTFESSSSFHSTREQQQQQQSHHDIETSSSSHSCMRVAKGNNSSKSDKRNFSECIEKAEDDAVVGSVTPAKKSRGKSDETSRKMTTVNFTFRK